MSIKTAQPSLLSIHEAALLLKVSTKTLRRWEAKNILVPERTEGKHRRYRFEAIANLKKTKSKVPSIPQAISHKPVVERVFLPTSYETVNVPITPQQFFESTIPTNKLQNDNTKKTKDRKPKKLISRVLFIVGLFIITATSAQAFGLQIKKLFTTNVSNTELINPADVLADTTVLQDLHFNINVPTKINADLVVTGNATASGNLNAGGNLSIDGIDNRIAGILTLTGNTLSATADLTINPLGGGVRIGTTGTPAINLAGGDLFVSDQLQVGTSITLGGDAITDFVGTGLSLVNGVLQSTIGTTVEGTEITDNTINEAKLTVSNDASNGRVLSYNSSTGGFTWIDQPSNSSPFQTTSNVANLITSTDDVTIGAATDLGKLAIVGDSDETQLLARGGSTQTAKIFDVQNSAATSLFSVDNTGNLITSGSLTLNSDSISDFTGNGLTLSSNALTIALASSADGLSSTTSNGSGLEVLSSGLSLIQGCGDGQLLKWSESADTWGCASDSGATSAVINVKNNGIAVGTNVDTVNFTTDFSVTESPSGTDNIAVADNILNFSEFSDTLTLDASTSIAFGASNLSFTFTNNGSANEIHNLSSTGDLVVQDNGTAFATFDDAGGVTLAPNGTSDVTLTLDSDSTLTLTGVQSSSGSALCLDGSNNVVTCTTGTGGIAGSGTSGQIAFFNGATTITSETSGFGWDATNNLLTVTSATTTSVANTFTDDLITSGKLALFTTAATAFTGNLVDITSTGGNASNTGNVLHVQAAATDAVVAAVITNLGSGTSFRVNDQTGDSDATPFIVDNAGNVGIGDPTPAALLTVGAGDVFQVNSSGAIAAATGITSSGTIVFSGLGTGYVKSTSGTLSVSAAVPTTDLSGTLFSNSSDSNAGTNTIVQGDTLAISGGTNGIDTSLSNDTYTINLDTTEIGTSTFGSGSGFTFTFDASAGTDTTLAFGNNSSTFTGNTFTVASSTTNADSLAFVPQNSTATNSFTGTVTSADLTAARTWTLPDDSGTVCLTTGNCAGVGGGITGSGTTGQVAYFSGSGTITSVAGFAWDTTTGQLTLVSTTSNADKLAFLGNSTGSNTFTGSVTSADLTGNQTWTFPNDTGTVCLTTGNCAGVGGVGTMNNFTAAGDTGGGQTISDGNTLSILGGTNGIDTVASATDTITLNLDTTEIGSTTYGSGSAVTWTFDASAGTDTTIAFGNNTQTFTTGTATFSGNVLNAAASRFDVSSAGALNLGTTTATSAVIGSSALTSLTVTTDGTGDSEVVLPSNSIGNAELVNSSITFAGDTGSSATSLGGTRTIAGGTNGIDTSESAGTFTLNLDTTEIADTTFGSGSGFTWTFDAGATDPTIAFASNQITIGGAATLSATGVTTFNCTDCINFDDLADSMTLDASTSIAGGNSNGLSITSDLTSGSRTTSLLSITQADDASNNLTTLPLVSFTNSDTASTSTNSPVFKITQVPGAVAMQIGFNGAGSGGSGLSILTIPVSGAGIQFPAVRDTSSTSSYLKALSGSSSSVNSASRMINFAQTNTFTGANTESGSYLYLNRTSEINGTSLAVTGDVASITSTCTQTVGTCTDNSNVLSLAQNYTSASGAVLDLTNAGTGQGVLLTSSSTGDLMELDSSGAVTTANGLVIAATNGSGVITDALDVSDAEIVNAVNAGANVILGTTASIDFSNFDVATSGNITVAASQGLDTNGAGELALGNTNATSVSICNSAACDTLSLGTNADADTITIGDSTDTVGINGSTTILGTTSINTSGSAATNIGTGTSTGTITIGLSSGTDLALADANWNVTGAGAANFASIGATTRGTALFTTLGTNGNVTIGDANTDTLVINAGSSGTGISFGDSSFATCTLTTVAGVLTCGSGGGSMSSFTAAGDSGSNQTISDGNTLSILGGTNGIDTVGSATDTITLNLDTTEITNTTFGAGSGYTWTFDAGATDPTIAFASDQITIGSASTLTATGVTTLNCTDCINFDDMADSMTLDASTSIATGNSLGLSVTSDISGGARSTDVVTISQASDVTNSSTGNLLQLTNSDASSTAALLSINQSSGGTGINFENYPGGTGVGINFTNNGSSIGTLIKGNVAVGSITGIDFGVTTTSSGSFTGNIFKANNVVTTTSTASDTGNFLNLSRSDVASGASTVVTVTGDVATISSTCSTASSGTCNDSSNVLSLAQNYTTASGAVLDLTNAGTGQGLLLTSSSTGDLMELDSSGAVTTANGLVIAATHASGVITDALDVSDAEIVNAVNAGANVILGTTASIDFSNFDVATTGNITVAAGVGIDTNASGILTVGNTTATTVNIGGTAATAINLGAGGALTRTIAIGTGTGADTINIGTGGTTADTITIGNNASTTSLALTSGTGSQTFSSSNATGTTTSSSFVFTDNALTTGTGAYINSSSVTTGNLLSLASTSTALSSGKLASFDWSPGSATTATGDLVNINIGTNGTTSGNLFSVSDTGSNLFSVSETGITANVPAAFNAAGDVTMAYDLQFTNQTASFIKALGPLTIDAGESFESNDLTFKTYNSGRIIGDVSNSGGMLISSNPSGVSSIGLLNVDGAATGKALAVFNESGDQNILTASASGTTVANIGRTGTISVAAGQGVDTLAAGTLALGNTTATTVNIGGTAATTINLGAGGALTRTIAIGTGTGADTINIGTGGTGADSITIGNNASTTALNFTSGTGAQTFTSLNATGATTSSSFVFTDNSLTTGTGAYLNSSSLTSGNLLSLASTSTVLTSGKLGSFDWSPGSATTATGDLFNINIGTNGTTTGNIFSVSDTASNLFSVSETQITSALPHQFTAAGDVSMAYDLQFTNQTASFIKSNAPLTLDTGEVFESNSLTLQTYNIGNILLNTGSSSTGTGKVGIGPSVTPVGLLHVSNVNESTSGLIGKALAIFDQKESQDILTASNSGTTRFSVNSAGNTFVTLRNTATFGVCHVTNGAGYDELTDCSGSVGADYMEMYPVDQAADKGTIVTTSTNYVTTTQGQTIAKLVPSTGAYQSNVIGIMSDPADAGDFNSTGYNIKSEDNPQPVALNGRVQVKIANDSEPIQPGDYITTSHETGRGMKATGAGVVIAKALDSWTPNSGKDTVMVFVQNTWYDPIAQNQNASGSTDLSTLTAQVSTLSSDFNTLVGASLTASSSGILANFDKVNTNSLAVLGDTVLANTVVNGTLNVGAMTFDNVDQSINAVGVLKIQSLALGNIEFEGGLVTIDTEGNVVANSITAQKYKVAGASAGTDTLTSGTTEIFVNSTAVTADSLVFITPKRALSYPLAVTEKQAGVGFKVTVSQSEIQDIDFDWFILDKTN